MRKRRGVLGGQALLDSIIEPIGMLSDGTLLYPVAGAENDEEDDAEYEEEEEEGEEDEDESDKDKSEEEKPKRRKKPSQRTPETPQQMKRRLNAEAKKHREEKELLEERLRQIEDKDKTELEIAKRDLTEVSDRAEKLEASNREMGFELAFLRYSVEAGYRWDDSEYVIHKLRKQGLEFVDDEVDGLQEAIDDLVKSKPSLLRQDEETDEGQATRGRTTGVHPRKPRKHKAAARTADQTAAKYGFDSLVTFGN